MEVVEVKKVKIEKNEDSKNIFDDLRHDFDEAKKAKTTIDRLINEWNDLYYAKVDTGNTGLNSGLGVKRKQNRSRIQIKEIAKQIEWQKPNITEPFVSSRNPIQVVDTKNDARSRHLEKWANHEFTEEFDREEFIDQLTDVLQREGTVWVQTSWETKKINDRIVLPSVTMEELMTNPQEPDEIEQNEDGTYKVEYNNIRLVRNNPDSTVCRNEHCFPDPGARTPAEMRFFAHIKLLTISDLKTMDWLDQDKVETLRERISSEDREDTDLGQERDADDEYYGHDTSYEPNDIVRKHIRIVEYWGYYDLNGDGIAEPMIAYWAEKYNINLGIEENPFPDKSIPFDRAVYSARPFSLWGNPLAFFLGENQRAKTGMVRGILDNMSLANNNQKFVMRGTLDYINFKRMNNGERHIIVNKADGIKDGSYNQIPSSVFNTLQMFTKESEDLAGVSSGGPALANELVSKDGSQMQLTMSQQRMAAVVRNISNLLRKMIGRWIQMAEIFLTDEQIMQIFGPNDEVDMNVFTLASSAKVKVRVGTEVNRNMKLQQYNMLMQQSKVLEEQLPPGAIKEMVAEMYDLFDMHEQANALRLYQPQPTPEEQQAKMLQLQNLQLENVKLQSEIDVMHKDVEARYMNAQARMMEAQANYGYKGAQTQEKLAKANSHQVEAALKPVEVENQVMKDQKSNQNNVGE